MGFVTDSDARAPEQAKLTTSEEYPTLQDSLITLQQQAQKDEIPTKSAKDSAAVNDKRDQDKARTTWFWISYSKIWGLSYQQKTQTSAQQMRAVMATHFNII